MKTAIIPLTEREKAFAEKKHDFVFQYLRTRRLNEDYYDVVIEAYIHSVRIWFARPELHRYAFEGVATKRMDGAARKHRIRENRVHFVYLDACVGENQSIPRHEFIPDTRRDFVEVVEQREIIAFELKKLPADEAAKLIDFCSVSGRKVRRYQQPGEPNPVVSCACGCGGTFPRFGKNGIWRDYLKGHNRRKRPHDNPLVPCKCGCGEMIHRYDRYGRRRDYIHGHNWNRGGNP